MKKDEFGVFEIFVPNNPDGTPAIAHNSKVKVRKEYFTRLYMIVAYAFFSALDVYLTRSLSLPSPMIKITMIKPDGTRIDRLPAWIVRVTQDLNVSPNYDAVFWIPPQKYTWKNKAPPKPKSLKVYEAHGNIWSKNQSLV